MMDAVVFYCGCWQAVLHGMSQLCTKSSNMMWLQTKLSPHFCLKFILYSVDLCILSNFPLDGHVYVVSASTVLSYAGTSCDAI